MSRPSARLYQIFLAALLLCVPSTQASQLPPLLSVSPLWISSLRPEGMEFDTDRTPGWSLALNLAYGNNFSMSPEVLGAHRQIDGTGQALSREAFEEAARSGTAIHAIDVESLRMDFEALFRWRSGAFVGARIPSWRIGGTALDPWPERVHSWIGVDSAGRDEFLQGRTFFGLSGDHGNSIIEHGLSPRMVSLDLWAGWRWELGHQCWHRGWVSTSLPLADLSPWGSRHLSWGLRWMAGHRFAWGEFSGGLGWSSEGGHLPTGGHPANSFHSWLGLSIDLGKGFEGGIMLRSDGSVYRDEDPGRVGRDSGEFSVGLSLPLAKNSRLQLAFGEDFPGMGLPPDFSLQTSLVWQLGRGN